MFFPSPEVLALSVKPATVRQLVIGATCIIKGTIRDAAVEEDPYESGSLVTYYTIAVEEALKGSCSGNHVFKQLARGPKGLPTYEVGKTYLLFLPEASAATGLSAPLGLWQGRYELVRSSDVWLIPALRKKNSVSRSLSKELSGLPQVRGNPSVVSTLDDYGRFRLVIRSILKESK